MIDGNAALRYYSRPEIQKEMVRCSRNREVAVRFTDSFGKRPDSLSYPADVLELVRQGATSFHISEELWRNPLVLNLEMKRRELDNLRTGFDLVFDIDCSYFDYSKIAADLIIKFLKHSHNISCVTAKFSGNKGFHIAVPFEALPKRIGKDETKDLFPELAQKIAFYIKERIKKHLGRKIMGLENNEFNKVMQKTGKKEKDIRGIDGETGEIFLDVEPFLVIDTILISSRHLFRAPYSLHEKSGLASVPINPERVLEFKKQEAVPESVKTRYPFLEKENIKEGEAKNLVMQAFEFAFEENKKKAATKTEKEFIIPATALPEKYFAPCIKHILNGLEDGRKRAVFILINYLRCNGWSYDDIEKLIIEWNEKNKEPLREVYWKSQLRYHKQQKKNILPPNCDNKAYYKDMRICFPEQRCRKIRNPVNYSLIRRRKM